MSRDFRKKIQKIRKFPTEKIFYKIIKLMNFLKKLQILKIFYKNLKVFFLNYNNRYLSHVSFLNARVKKVEKNSLKILPIN